MDSTNPPQSTVLLFGSQVESLSKESLAEIKNTLLDTPSHKWILSTLSSLPTYWTALSTSLPKVTDTIGIRGQDLLADLESWVRCAPRGGEDDLLESVLKTEKMPSVVLSPLVVLIQLAQYRRFLEGGRGVDDEERDLQTEAVAKGTVSTLGFCMGLLGAFAVASAGNMDELDKYGSVAVRLAMVGGALIDAQDEWKSKQGLGPSKSYVTAWRNDKQRDDMRQIVDKLFPEAYVSVLYDEQRSTITTSERAAPRLLRQLRAAGVTAVEVGFRGDIHSPKPETRTSTDELLAFCNSMPGLQLPEAAGLALPSYTNAGDGTPIAPGAGLMHEIALRTVFTQQCDWYGTFEKVQAACLGQDEAVVMAFGPDRCTPPTLARQLGTKLVHFADLHVETVQALPSEVDDVPLKEEQPAQAAQPEQPEQPGPPLPQQETITVTKEPTPEDDDSIAVVGMSIKVAGADDLDEFSRMLQTGKSQHQIIPPERMRFDTSLYRDGEKDSRNYYANLMRDVDAFDHKFFKKSPRESAAMDPQQRLLMQAAYQAVEQAGYFTETIRGSLSEKKEREHVGVYIGAPAVDYEHNVACHTANAFTATGNLQSFVAGRVAHYFGWTGPALTLDTACSSSAVAIHTACRNLLTGECNAALAGGVALFTNPLWFQNLAAANFLSPTGQCKPFDAQADGFCRAEGIACVFLKRMSDAVADGNPIFGRIASSAVYQNQNSTPLFVPNSPSLSQLFKDVIKQANVAPGDISLVEAHGTGTPVGDPAEYESIRLALGGSEVRSKPLPLGSVKGHVGHTEGTSGVVSLIKVLMMMRENYIPPQASFSRLSPGIGAKPSDMIEVVTSLRPWSAVNDHKVALINNYGAGGSNAAIVVSSAPVHAANNGGEQPSLPFRISGIDVRSIKAHAAKMASFVKSKSGLKLADISFNVNRHSNPALSQGLIFNCRSVAELETKLSTIASSKSSNAAELGIENIKAERPVILCFGGQVSTLIGLDRKAYDSVALLRHHLDECDAVIQSAGLDSIYPDIFSRTPCEDPVHLQTMLFAMQYASAKSWIDCGLSGKIASVVGHSFGELTALCISGVLSLRDAIKLIARRAQLVRDVWGLDKGAMMAVEADESVVQELLSDYSASIACYNGPRSFTLAGSVNAIDALAETIAQNGKFSAIKSKKLNVTNAFHSSLVDPLVEHLNKVGEGLTFQEPLIPLERATETRSGLSSDFVAEHMRKPVFFNHAIRRLAKEHPSAIFLEAGSSSTITVMASRALSTTGGSHHFQAVNITNNKGLDSLTDTTVSLWKQGLNVSFWAYHARQTNEYASLVLPPYQFEKSRHWLELKSPLEAVEKAAARLAGSRSQIKEQPQEIDERNLGLWSFIGYLNKKDTSPRFRINTGSDKYKKLIAGHVIAQTAPICPGTLQMDIAIEALFSLYPEWKAEGLQPVVHDMTNLAPLCVDPSREVWLDFKPLEDQTQWEWKISSDSNNDTQMHVEGRLHIRSPTDTAYIAEFARFERLVSYVQCAALLAAAGRDGDGVDAEVLQGRNVYRTFAEFVDYADIYRGVRSIVSRGDECAGRVHRKYTGETWLDVMLDDCFSQVSGLWVNCMTDIAPGDMYIANGCEMSMRSPHSVIRPKAQDVWHVYARSTRQSATAYVTDVFVFDAASGKLAEVMLGIQYTQVPKVAMSRMLLKMTGDKSVLRSTAGQAQVDAAVSAIATPSSRPVVRTETRSILKKQKKDVSVKAPSPEKPDITDQVRKSVASVAGMEVAEVQLDTALADIGIDSLMGMELGREIDDVFKCTLDQTELLQATNVRQLVQLISGVLFGAEDAIPTAVQTKPTPKRSKKSFGKPDITDQVRKLVATVAGMEVNEVTPDTELADIGIDSLMGMELSREIDGVFKHTIDQTELLQATSVRQLVALITSVVFTGQGEGSSDDDRNESSSDHDDWSNSSSVDTYTPPDTGRATPDVKEFLAQEVRSSGAGGLEISGSDFLECFGAVKMGTDKQLSDLHLDNIDRVIIAATSRLCVALIVEAFEKLGCDLRTAASGDAIERVPYLPQYERLMEWMYEFLETDARLVNISAGKMTRTAVPVPSKSSETIMNELLGAHADWAVTTKLIYHSGKPLAGVLSGETDGIKVLFGSAEGRDLVAALYRDHPFNIMLAGQMCDLIGRLAERVQGDGLLKILEMGAGTGGTTVMLAPFLASLNIPLEYTFTDLSSSMVAAARRKFGKQYPFMRFAVHDIEKPLAEELRGQHVILASNAVHATHNLVVSATNIHDGLRPDGFLMLLEQTECMPFSNLIFGLLEGWWLFDDGRTHAIVSTERWERDLHTAGFGHVDWTDGQLPENNIQRVIVALASGPIRDRLPIPEARPDAPEKNVTRDLTTREADAERYVAEYTAGWATPSLSTSSPKTLSNKHDAVILVTGATGSLGSHLVASFAENPDVKTVVCVNRRSGSTAVETRQAEAFSKRGITLSSAAQSKLRIIATDTSRPRLGLDASEYEWFSQHGTHIVHNAWPMSGTRPITAFEPQFSTMRSLLDLAREMSSNDPTRRIGFQLVTSIGVVGHSGQARMREERVPISSVLPTGYCEAKWVCERMLDETLHKFPAHFRPMVVRPGQIAGSTKSGVWNPVEHFAFLAKSAYSLRAWPDFNGTMQWIPVDAAAGGMADLLYIGNEVDAPESYPVYHIDNPVGQPWKEMSPVLAAELGIPGDSIVPFQDWLRRVSRAPLPETDNPANRIIDFLDGNFERMSCGGLILGTDKAKEHSTTMAGLGPVSADVARRYVRAWKEMGVLAV